MKILIANIGSTSFVQLKGWKKVGSGLCTVFVTGDVAAVKAGVDAGSQAPCRRRSHERACHRAASRRRRCRPAK